MIKYLFCPKINDYIAWDQLISKCESLLVLFWKNRYMLFVLKRNFIIKMTFNWKSVYKIIIISLFLGKTKLFFSILWKLILSFMKGPSTKGPSISIDKRPSIFNIILNWEILDENYTHIAFFKESSKII